MIHELGIVTNDIDKMVETLMAAGYADWERDLDKVFIKEYGQNDVVLIREVEVRTASNSMLMPDITYQIVQRGHAGHYVSMLEAGSIAHFGIIVSDEKVYARDLTEQWGLHRLVQEYVSLEHSRPEKRFHYHHAIYESSVLPGYVKLMRRISEEQRDAFLPREGATDATVTE